jgi:hypothetical protein
MIRDLQAYRDAAQQGTVVTRMKHKARDAALETHELCTELAGQSLMQMRKNATYERREKVAHG